MSAHKTINVPWFFRDENIKCNADIADEFFPERFGKHATEAARSICSACQLRQECLEYALDTRQTEGIWGGLDPGQRKVRLKTWRNN